MNKIPTMRMAVIAATILFVLLWLFFGLFYQSHLLWQEQNQIFLYTGSWISTYFGDPSNPVHLLGDWLTQFYCRPWVGAFILSLALSLSVLLFAVLCAKTLPKVWGIVLTVIFAVYVIGRSMQSDTPLSFFILILLALAIVAVDLQRKRLGVAAKVFCWVFVLIGLAYSGFAWPSMPEFKQEERMAIADAFSARDYERTKKLALNVKESDDATGFYYHLATAMQDSLPDCLLKYPNYNLGTLTTINDKTPLTVINMMNDLYYELGDMTYAERAAMMRNVFSPQNRNVRMIKRLAEINLVSGDTLAALKYLGILNKTRAYRDWSGKQTPGKMSADVQADILRRRALANNKDNIRLGDNCRNILLELLESNPDNTVALDYLLCTDLLLKDMDTFKMDYDTYCMDKNRPRYKDLYQQALMIYLAGTDALQSEWDKYIVPGPLTGQFRNYSQRRGSQAYKDTYWYFFDRKKINLK